MKKDIAIHIMAALLLAFTSLPVCIAVDQGQDKEEADKVPERKLPELKKGEWEPLFELGENIYPSIAISTATLKAGIWDDNRHLGDNWGVVGVAVRGTADNCPVRVEVSGGNFIKPSVFTGTLADSKTVYCVYPDLRYEYEKLLNVKQTVPETLSLKVTMGGGPQLEKTVRVQVRPVNECISYFIDSSGNINDVSALFAAYVNENHPAINRIMKDALTSKRADSFAGYQGEADDVMTEIEAIWDTLQKRGVRYSSIASSGEEDNPYIGSQHVRLLGESIRYTQANCVDSSVLMASIFRKIGLNTSLIILPDHMFVSVDLAAEGKKTVFIETTMLGEGSLEEAIEDGYEQFSKNKDKFDSRKEDEQDYNIVNIQEARAAGIMPIKDSSAD